MTKINLGKIKFNWRGEYHPQQTYDHDDVVFYDGSSYIATKPIAINTPPPDPNTGWDLMTQGLSTAVQSDIMLKADNIHQIIQNDVRDPYYYSSSGLKEITPLTTTITPSSITRKILIMVNLSYECHNDSMFHLTRNNINLSSPNAPELRLAGIMPASFDQDHASTLAFASLFFVDNPQTISPITYRLTHTGQPLAVNRTLGHGNTTSYEVATSRMILQEV